MIVLDTHVLIWLNDSPEKIPVKARKAIGASTELGIAAISLWEVAMLTHRGKIELTLPVQDWLEVALSPPKLYLLPLTPKIAQQSVEMELHGDPADRLIVATAIVHHAKLITADKQIASSGLVEAIWK